MVEREIERIREPEPEIDHYQASLERRFKMRDSFLKAKRVVKFSERKWQQTRQSLEKRYAGIEMEDVPGYISAPFWNSFLQRIVKHSGKHRHQGGMVIYVVEGKGYTVIDGVRYDWKKGDLLILPIKPGGVEHQHFNANKSPDEPAVWLAFRWNPLADYMAVTTEQVEKHPDWPAGK
ncbi:MAG: cupin domain-containing protein [Chloroflexi bacterium]|nr:cupin domain-containing protein [Chloroflexota bacterium]